MKPYRGCSIRLPISFKEAIPIAVLGLVVNVVSAWLLSGGHDHSHGHHHSRTMMASDMTATSNSRSTITRTATARITATTTCGPRWFT